METVTMRPDEKAFRGHIAAGLFQLGAHHNRWKLGEIAWPIVQIAVAAAGRDGAPNEYWFSFNCSGYSQDAPTARPWDHEADQPLPFNRWPGGTSRIPAVFNPGWNGGTCLYLPCDRVAAAGHENWRTQYPALQWCPARGIVLYLEELHSLLNSSDYKGVRGG